MIVVRNIFRLKFGDSKKATDLWKQAIEINKKLGYGSTQTRLLTDLAGAAYYTVVLETTHESLADFEKASQAVRGSAEWRKVYDQIVPLVEEGRREIYSVIV